VILKEDFLILVADRNRHVRDFLKRELEHEGYQVMLAASCQQIIRIIYQLNFCSLIILDPDLPDIDESLLLDQIKHRAGDVPIIFHTFRYDRLINGADEFITSVIEKRGDSIEEIKNIVGKVRFAGLHNRGHYENK